jgi:hypothetical protein
LIAASLLGLVATGAVVAQRKLRERRLRVAGAAVVKEPQAL